VESRRSRNADRRALGAGGPSLGGAEGRDRTLDGPIWPITVSRRSLEDRPEWGLRTRCAAPRPPRRRCGGNTPSATPIRFRGPAGLGRRREARGASAAHRGRGAPTHSAIVRCAPPRAARTSPSSGPCADAGRSSGDRSRVARCRLPRRACRPSAGRRVLVDEVPEDGAKRGLDEPLAPLGVGPVGGDVDGIVAHCRGRGGQQPRPCRRRRGRRSTELREWAVQS